jgi:hypothetical protein
MLLYLIHLIYIYIHIYIYICIGTVNSSNLYLRLKAQVARNYCDFEIGLTILKKTISEFFFSPFFSLFFTNGLDEIESWTFYMTVTY